MTLTLGIETSCDECSASIVEKTQSGYRVISLATYSQIPLHQKFGGVVPEVASRNHLDQVVPVLRECLNQASISLSKIDAISVTHRPGLMGALWVGVTAAKTLSLSRNKPVVPIHHLEGHFMSVFLDQSLDMQFPLALLMVSGGHTQLHAIPSAPHQWSLNVVNESRVGAAIDDAAGEAFDKTAKTMGFPYPGGRYLDQESQRGNPRAYAFPRSMLHSGDYQFSFSGLKTALKLEWEKQEKLGTALQNRSDLAASVQEAIIEVLTIKLERLCKERGFQDAVIVGGVSANSRLRKWMNETSLKIHLPIMKYCTDNAAMIAAAGANRFEQGHAWSVEKVMSLRAFPNGEDAAIQRGIR